MSYLQAFSKLARDLDLFLKSTCPIYVWQESNLIKMIILSNLTGISSKNTLNLLNKTFIYHLAAWFGSFRTIGRMANQLPPSNVSADGNDSNNNETNFHRIVKMTKSTKEYFSVVRSKIWNIVLS